jgi:DNA-binding SARP family transcriptional activator
MLGQAAAQVRLFGGLRVVLPSTTLQEGAIATKAAAVVKLLAIRPGHTVHRDEIVGTLWVDASERQGANNLYKALHQLREQVPDPESREIVQIRRGVVTLAPWVEIDLDRFLIECETARATKSRDAYDRALAYTTAQILPCDIYEDWTQGVRELTARLDRQLRFEAAELCRLDGDAPRAGEYLHAILATEPTNERAHRLLMQLYSSDGEAANLARQYETCVTALDTEFGLQPSEETTALYQELIASR